MSVFMFLKTWRLRLIFSSYKIDIEHDKYLSIYLVITFNHKNALFVTSFLKVISVLKTTNILSTYKLSDEILPYQQLS